MSKDKKDIVFAEARGGNWEALYIDGTLVFENHEISTAKLLKLLDIDYKYIRCECDHTMPKKIEDVKKIE